jgi:hypothetical protein
MNFEKIETKREQEIYNQAKEQSDNLTGNEFQNLFRVLSDIHAKIIWNQISTIEFNYALYCQEISNSEIGSGNITFRKEITTNFEAKPLSKEVVDNWHWNQRNWID